MSARRFAHDSTTTTTARIRRVVPPVSAARGLRHGRRCRAGGRALRLRHRLLGRHWSAPSWPRAPSPTGTCSGAATASACSRCRRRTRSSTADRARCRRPPSPGATRTTRRSRWPRSAAPRRTWPSSHLTREKNLARAGLLTEITDDMLALVGLSPDDFNAKAWETQKVDGQARYAIPLDTHPFVLYYNRDVCDKAGLLELRRVNLKEITRHRRLGGGAEGGEGGDRGVRARRSPPSASSPPRGAGSRRSTRSGTATPRGWPRAARS